MTLSYLTNLKKSFDYEISSIAVVYATESVCVCVFSFREWTGPSFRFGELGNFALFELPTFLWGTLIKMKSNLLEIL